MNKRFYFRVLTLLYLSLIFYISSLSQPVKLPPFPGFDKIIHFFEFGLAGYLVYNSIDNIKKNRDLFSIVFSVIYGGLDEIHQYFVPGRTCSWTDFFADSMGIVFTVLMFGSLKKKS
ncbi:MAG: VanZ family protein [bacterium]